MKLFVEHVAMLTIIVHNRCCLLFDCEDCIFVHLTEVGNVHLRP